MCLEYQKNSGGFLTNTASRCISNPATHSDKDWYTLKTEHHTPAKAIWCMQSSAMRNAKTSTLEKQNNHCTNVWHNTGELTPQAWTLLSIYISRRKPTPLKTVMFTS